MGKAKTWTYVIIAGIVVIAIYSFMKDEGPGEYDSFAQCLTDKGIVMYGTDWCPHCKNQKKLFGKSFDYVNYVNCDLFKDACNVAGVTGYPTWKIENQNYPGTQALQKLSLLSDCPLV
jgi:glutaredoxin